MKKRTRLFIYFFLGLFLSIGFVSWFLVGSDYGSGFLINSSVSTLAKDLDIELRVADFSGNFLNALRLENLWGRQISSKLTFSADKLSLEFSFSRIFSSGLYLSKIECPIIRIWGPPNPNWLSTIPDLPALGCFAAPNMKIQIGELRVKKIEWSPVASGPVNITISDLALAPASTANNIQTISCGLNLEFRGKSLCKGKFNGTTNLSSLWIQGYLEIEILGRKLASEIKTEIKKTGITANGNIHPSSIQLASFSDWLSPLWREQYPAAVRGNISLQGSWFYDTTVGFLGNLQGEMKECRLEIPVLFMTILDINGKWSFSEGFFKFSDEGSNLMQAPAIISGGFQHASGKPLAWNLDVAVPLFHIEETLASLPWALRYSLGFSDISGPASFIFQIRGNQPTYYGNISFSSIKTSKPGANALCHGRMEFRRFTAGQAEWSSEIKWESPISVPRVCERIIWGSLPLSTRLQPPVSLDATFKGPTTNHLDFQGELKSNMGNFRLSGLWTEGEWREFSVTASSPGNLPGGVTKPITQAYLTGLTPGDLSLLFGK